MFLYHDAFNPNRNEVAELKERYEKGTVGDVEVKTQLVEVLHDLLEPMRRRRAAYAKDLATVYAILEEGTNRGREVVSATLVTVRTALRIDHFRCMDRTRGEATGCWGSHDHS